MACVFWTFSVSLAERQETKFRRVCHWFLAHHMDRSSTTKKINKITGAAIRPYGPRPTALTRSHALLHTDGQRVHF